MVAHFTMSTYGVNHPFQFAKGIWLHRKSGQIRFFFSRKRPILHHTCPICSKLPSYISTMKVIQCLVYLSEGNDLVAHLSKELKAGLLSIPLNHGTYILDGDS